MQVKAVVVQRSELQRGCCWLEEPWPHDTRVLGDPQPPSAWAWDGTGRSLFL